MGAASAGASQRRTSGRRHLRDLSPAHAAGGLEQPTAQRSRWPTEGRAEVAPVLFDFSDEPARRHPVHWCWRMSKTWRRSCVVSCGEWRRVTSCAKWRRCAKSCVGATWRGRGRGWKRLGADDRPKGADFRVRAGCCTRPKERQCIVSRMLHALRRAEPLNMYARPVCLCLVLCVRSLHGGAVVR